MEEMGDNDFIRYFVRPVRIITFQVKDLLKDDNPENRSTSKGRFY